jgi:uroporphyrinogen III methyltransferase/synthase
VSGIVHLVGAGPGDPELITVRGRRLLETADAVVHDRLVGRELLELIPPGTLRIDVGKAGYRHAVPQAEINAMLVRIARAGLAVVRLKGGDPFVFGRGGEEAAALRAAGIPFEIVPGVTAGVAGPAYAGIPVTHRGVARSVAFVTGHEDTAAGGPPIDWTALARVDTLVVYMAGRTAGIVAAHLVRAGRAPDTPAALVLDASLPSQEVRLADLASFAAAGGGSTDGRPALLVVGEAAALHDKLAWFTPVSIALAAVSR